MRAGDRWRGIFESLQSMSEALSNYRVEPHYLRSPSIENTHIALSLKHDGPGVQLVLFADAMGKAKLLAPALERALSVAERGALHTTKTEDRIRLRYGRS